MKCDNKEKVDRIIEVFYMYKKKIKITQNGNSFENK